MIGVLVVLVVMGGLALAVRRRAPAADEGLDTPSASASGYSTTEAARSTSDRS